MSFTNFVESIDPATNSAKLALRRHGLAPKDDRESAIVMTLAPDSYTAIVRGKNDTIGIALVELYNIGP